MSQYGKLGCKPGVICKAVGQFRVPGHTGAITTDHSVFKTILRAACFETSSLARESGPHHRQRQQIDRSCHWPADIPLLGEGIKSCRVRW